MYEYSAALSEIDWCSQVSVRTRMSIWLELSVVSMAEMLFLYDLMFRCTIKRSSMTDF